MRSVGGKVDSQQALRSNRTHFVTGSNPAIGALDLTGHEITLFWTGCIKITFLPIPRSVFKFSSPAENQSSLNYSADILFYILDCSSV
ncbi:hypothetical protein PoB_002225500 [Plakobranchus ocellatus]|uniref:Uncharacterized protein n=1 Tax=Plakobranchus ocellatus TaxID=259542 RepID=A0AAV3ZJD0_9GAST|nr:hypothetical protein PoB_002225500 [Plakobranchus ocellatus]